MGAHPEDDLPFCAMGPGYYYGNGFEVTGSKRVWQSVEEGF